mmetsp:Transcript_1709/g.3278  ORF Transcript_1709/g.3278 Transcript_1709/m.3278 type:complete len:137 (+) Transcript_1709:1131-1541(+)
MRSSGLKGICGGRGGCGGGRGDSQRRRAWIPRRRGGLVVFYCSSYSSSSPSPWKGIGEWMQSGFGDVVSSTVFYVAGSIVDVDAETDSAILRHRPLPPPWEGGLSTRQPKIKRGYPATKGYTSGDSISVGLQLRLC